MELQNLCHNPIAAEIFIERPTNRTKRRVRKFDLTAAKYQKFDPNLY